MAGRRPRNPNLGGFREGAGRKRKRIDDENIATKTIEAHVTEERKFLRDREWEILRDAFILLVEEKVGNDAKAIVRQALQSREEAKRMRSILDDNAPEGEPIEPPTACGILLHTKLKKEEYKSLRTMTNEAAKFDVYPSYEKVRVYKNVLRPDGTVITETRASVPVQNLLQHTLERMVESESLDIDKKLAETGISGVISCQMTCSYGYDAATGQRPYKQAYEQNDNETTSDESLFACVLNPLILANDDGICLWKNGIPQSPLFVRPIILEFARETEEYVMTVHRQLQNEIAALQPIRVTTAGGYELEIRANMLLTMIDGKIFNYLGGTNSQQCPVCEADRTQMNTESNVGTAVFRPKATNLKFGLQPLHGWIKVARHLFNLGYSKPGHDQGLKGDEAKTLKLATKKKIQREFLRKGLRIDFPSQFGYGSSMDGNTARRAFKDLKEFARILDVKEELVTRYWYVVLCSNSFCMTLFNIFYRIILCCINNTHYKLDPEKFDDYCKKTFTFYKKHYGWFNISPSVHKYLTHSVEIQQRVLLPLGVLSEGAAEHAHRIRKLIRLGFTRKTSRLHTMTDLFNRCLDLSDPLLSSWYARQKKLFIKHEKAVEKLPAEACALLVIDEQPRRPTTSPNPDNAALTTAPTRRSGRTRAIPRATSETEELSTAGSSNLTARVMIEQEPVAGPSRAVTNYMAESDDDEAVNFVDTSPTDYETDED